MDKRDITLQLRNLNTPDKISCISAAMVEMEPDNIIALLGALKETAKKIIQSEINTVHKSKETMKKQVEECQSAETYLINAMDRL